MTEKQIREIMKATQELALSRLPEEEGEHEFSPQFQKNMKKLIDRDAHPLRYHAKWVAAILFAGIGTLLAFTLRFRDHGPEETQMQKGMEVIYAEQTPVTKKKESVFAQEEIDSHKYHQYHLRYEAVTFEMDHSHSFPVDDGTGMPTYEICNVSVYYLDEHPKCNECGYVDLGYCLYRKRIGAVHDNPKCPLWRER